MRFYHWKHGWIPLDHAAALSKAKGSHAGAKRELAKAAAAGHAHPSAGGTEQGTHIRGAQPVGRDHLPRAPHIVAAFSPETRKFALHDPHTERTIAISERLADHLQEHGHTITAVHRGVITRDAAGLHRHFKYDGSNVPNVVPAGPIPPDRPAPHAAPPHAGHDHREDFDATHTLQAPRENYGRTYHVLRPTGGVGTGVYISGALAAHIGDHKVIGVKGNHITTVTHAGEIRRYHANGSNIDKPVKPRVTPKPFVQHDLAGWTHERPGITSQHLSDTATIRRRSIPMTDIARSYVKGNRRVTIGANVSDHEAERFLNHVDNALTRTETNHPLHVHVPEHDRGLSNAYGYVMLGDDGRIVINKTLLGATGQTPRDQADFKSEIHKRTSPALYTLVHELGHIHDFHNGTNTARPGAHDLFTQARSRGHLSTYGQSNKYEGYAEAFAQHHLAHDNAEARAAYLRARQTGRLGNEPEHPHVQGARAYAQMFGWR